MLCVCFSATSVCRPGRYRQLQQVGVEAIGVDDPALDVEVIAIADAGFRSLGLDGFRLGNHLPGDESCCPAVPGITVEFLFDSIST